MTASDKKLRIGVIGTGYLGRFHTEKYAKMMDVELVGVADVDQDAAIATAGKFDCRAFFDHRDFFGKVDAVSIVTSTPYHYKVGRDLLANDIDVMIEKPMTTTLEEADELIELAESHNRILQVGHLERFNPAVVALKELVNEPLFIESHRLSIFQPRGTDVSVVLDLMIHDIDLILNFVPSTVTEIRAAGIPVISDHGDISNARIEFENGCIANVTASRISMKNERKLRMFQKNGYISVDFASREITYIHRNGTETESIIPGMAINKRCFTQGDALESELKSFVNAVKTRSVPEVTGEMGRDALKIALQIMDQMKTVCQKFKDL